MAPKLNYMAPEIQYVALKFKIKINEFLYHKKPPALYQENYQRRRFDTHPPPHRCWQKIKTEIFSPTDA